MTIHLFNTEGSKNSNLFRYLTGADVVCIIISVLCACIAGVTHPFTQLVYGTVTEQIIEYVLIENDGPSASLEKAKDKLEQRILYFSLITCALGLLVIIMFYIAIICITRTSTKYVEISRLRLSYFESVLNKDISWYDTHQTGDIVIRITEDVLKVEEAIGDKIVIFIYYCAAFISGVIFGFVKGWELTLVCLVYLPVSLIGIGLVFGLSTKLVQKEMFAYREAAAIANEVMSSIRTVSAFEGQSIEAERYDKCLRMARKNNIRRALFTALNHAIMWLLVFCSYSLSFYYGIRLVIEHRDLPASERIYTPETVIAIFFSIMLATWNIGICLPYIQMFIVARASALMLFKVIDEPPIINLSKNVGMVKETLEGNIRFEDVHFHYPSRPDVKTLQGITLNINSGETVALVGASGCGKSTCLQLIQRFYDPVAGNISIDGVDVKDYDLTWLRSQIGNVGQEPILFDTNIEENIRYGNQAAFREDIEAAARKANAHDFIVSFPQGYHTKVGESGAQLSGGQKQRIAIARAMVRKPSILLLDEATSALDVTSEALVQKAIDMAKAGCTTLIVAHRLSTIQGANRIIVLSEGQVMEEGTHDELMALKEEYYNLVTAQMLNDEPEEEIDMELFAAPSALPSARNSEKASSVRLSEGTPEPLVRPKFSKTMKDILLLNKPEWCLISTACISAFFAGASLPLFSVVFGRIVRILGEPDSNYVITEGDKCSLLFAIIGVFTGLAVFFQWYLFGISGEKLTLRARSMMFRSMLRQEMSWYDASENSVGALNTRLAVDAAGMKSVSGQLVGIIINCLSTVCIAIGISFYYDYRLTLVTLIIFPCIFLVIYLENKFSNATTYGSRESIESASKIAVEAVGNIRTVASLGMEKTFVDMFVETMRPHYARIRRIMHIRGLVLGLAMSLIDFGYAISMYYGGYLIRTEDLDFEIVYKVSEALISAAWSVGNAVAFTPNLLKGFKSSAELIRIINRQPGIVDADDAIFIIWDKSTITYEDVYFSYPTRPRIPILRGLDLEVLYGKTVALVGSSGSGKSTIIQLLERFYDPVAGEIRIDKNELHQIKISSLRSQLGLVSQEPNLFDRTISENIAYGDNSRVVEQNEIIEAARSANIHNFISTLPLSYNTRLGEKGSQLSGGQKQRIAIARALVRNPQVLLLDEATSALDTESEKIVQEALDRARKGRTCITIAHRLITIQDADMICYVEKGAVIERGTHQELIAMRGRYYKMYSMQKKGGK